MSVAKMKRYRTFALISFCFIFFQDDLNAQKIQKSGGISNARNAQDASINSQVSQLNKDYYELFNRQIELRMRKDALMQELTELENMVTAITPATCKDIEKIFWDGAYRCAEDLTNGGKDSLDQDICGDSVERQSIPCATTSGSMVRQREFDCATERWSDWTIVETTCPSACQPEERKEVIQCPDPLSGTYIAIREYSCSENGTHLLTNTYYEPEDWMESCTMGCISRTVPLPESSELIDYGRGTPGGNASYEASYDSKYVSLPAKTTGETIGFSGVCQRCPLGEEQGSPCWTPTKGGFRHIYSPTWTVRYTCMENGEWKRSIIEKCWYEDNSPTF